jgi:N-methylhydantoinase A
MGEMDYVIGVDIGGTFTDCVVLDEVGRITLGKALSTPNDFSVGAVDSVRDAARSLGFQSEDELIRSARLFFHACTIGDNTLITRTGARTAIITTQGFADTILMMRGKVTEGLAEEEAAHVSVLSKPEPIVARPFIEEVAERIDYRGRVLIPLDEKSAADAISRLIDKGVESIAITLLWSITNDAHERALANFVKACCPQVFFCLSSEVAPFLGEYERTATTVLNAYIAPKISAYLASLAQVLATKGLRREPLIMQAYGGVVGIEATSRNAIGTIESGPASGVVGTQFLGNLIKERNVLATDMGGTTFKVSLVRDGRIERDYHPVILRYNILSTKIWVESIGAGGGSIAWIDPETRLLKVGPRGAGASPGPACYGVGGTEPTVSDADLILGYLNPDYFLGGRIKLDKGAAIEATREKIASVLGTSVVEAASGIYRIANAHMSDLIRKLTVERGHDPRDFVLFAFGGAAPVHASRYAAELGIRQVVIPLTASVHGATGLISSDVVYEYGKSEHIVVPAEPTRINANFGSLYARAYHDLKAAGFHENGIRILRSVDMRYRYQVHELTVPLAEGSSEIMKKDLEELYNRFDDLYEKTFGKGSGYREAGMEILTLRVSAIGELKKPSLRSEPLQHFSADAALKGEREVYFEEQAAFAITPIYDFDRLWAGAEISGPAIIETPITTMVVNPRDHAVMDEFRNVRIHVGL